MKIVKKWFDDWIETLTLAIEIEAVELSGKVHEFGHLRFPVDCYWWIRVFTDCSGWWETKAELGARNIAVPDIAGWKCTERKEGHFRFSQTQRRAVAFHTIPILGQTVGIALEVHRSFWSRSRSCKRQANFRCGQEMSLSAAQEHFKPTKRLAHRFNDFRCEK